MMGKVMTGCWRDWRDPHRDLGCLVAVEEGPYGILARRQRDRKTFE